MKSHLIISLALLRLMTGCKGCNGPKPLDDLSSIKRDFLQSIFQEPVDESPFSIHYTFRTVFFSKNVISLFGEISVYDHLPHGWGTYEGKTFCKINNQFQEIALNDLFTKPEQKEFLRSYCENELKNTYGQLTYLAGENPLCQSLTEKQLRTFVIDDQFLIIIFQPYSVGGCGDGPFVVKIPYKQLEGHWDPANPLKSLIPKIVSSQSFTSSWDEDRFCIRDQEDPL